MLDKKIEGKFFHDFVPSGSKSMIGMEAYRKYVEAGGVVLSVDVEYVDKERRKEILKQLGITDE